MISFWELCVKMEQQDDEALLDGAEESKAMRVVKHGKTLRGKEDGSFWEDFMNVCGDADGLSELLDVPTEKIATWQSKIKDLLSKIDNEPGKKTTMVHTGTEPSEPTMKEPSQDVDTRPMP